MASVSYMNHNANKYAVFARRGGGGGGGGLIFKNKIGLIFRPSCPLAYINLHVTRGSTPIRIFVRLMFA